MRAIELSWEACRAVITVLREKALPYMLEHAKVIEEQLERQCPNEHPAAGGGMIDIALEAV